VGHFLAPLAELACQQLPGHFVSNFARKLFELDERASRPKTLLLDLGKSIHDRCNPGIKFAIHR
jgi:hypothetical protein